MSTSRPLLCIKISLRTNFSRKCFCLLCQNFKQYFFFCMSVLTWKLKLNASSTEISKRVSAGGVCWTMRESVCVCACANSISPCHRPVQLQGTSPLKLHPAGLIVPRYRVSQCVGYEHTGGHTNSHKYCVILVDTPLPAGENDISDCWLDKNKPQLDDNHSCEQASISTMLKSCTLLRQRLFFLTSTVIHRRLKG